MTLFDTDVLIDVLRGDGHARSVLEAARPDAALTHVTVLELLSGCRDRREQQVVERFIATFATVSIDAAASTRAIGLMRQFHLSHGLKEADALIAAVALENALPFVSKNQKHYRFIPDLDLRPYP